MAPEEALIALNFLLPEKLKDLQELVFRYSWEGWTYSQIANQLGYGTDHIRDIGSRLWQQLSEAFGEPVTKKNIQTILRRKVKQQQSLLSQSDAVDLEVEAAIVPLSLVNSAAQVESSLPRLRQYWEEAIDASTFRGCTHEMALLEQWIFQEHCRLIALTGMGGIGKTSLAAKLAQHCTETANFQFVIWQTLRNAPPLQEILTRLLQLLCDQQIAPSETVEGQISQLMTQLNTSRCLLILDNYEAILGRPKSFNPAQSGLGQEHVEEYSEFLRRIGSGFHSSCVVLTSREKPSALIPLEGDTFPVRILPLAGLDTAEVQIICEANGCQAASVASWSALTKAYSGNPLALKIVATTVREMFGGNIAEFLAHGVIAFGNINALLDEQFYRLGDLEKQVMYWLAVNRECMSLNELREDLLPSFPKAELLDTVSALRRRSLIEKATPTGRNTGQFTLQPVVMEYVTAQFIHCISGEIQTQEVTLFCSHALIKAQAKDYIRESQVRVILTPLVQHLIGQFRSAKAVVDHLNQLLFKLQTEFPAADNYAGGNLINLLRQLEVDLSGYDFSHLKIWQAYLVGADLHRVNFAHADLTKSVFTEVLNGVLSVAFSPDGSLFAVSSTDGTIRVYQTANYRELMVWKGHLSWGIHVTFSPDGQTLASSSTDHTIKLWSVATGECRKTFIGHTGWVSAVAFSPTGQILASSSQDRTIKIWDIDSGDCIETLHEHTDFVTWVAFSPDGQCFVSSSWDGTIRLWQVETRQCLRTLQGHTRWVRCVTFSPDGRTLASGSWDSTVRLWDVTTGQCLKVLQGHTDPVTSVTFSPDGQTCVSAGSDCTIRVWDVRTGQCMRILQKHSGWIWSIAFHPEGHTLASGGLDYRVILWDTETDTAFKTLSGYSLEIKSIAFHANGRTLASGSHDSTVKLWDIESGECSKTLQGHQSWVWCVAFSPDGQMLASSSNYGNIRLWNTATGQFQTLRGWTSIANLVHCVAFSPEGQFLASTDTEPTIRVWDVKTGECRTKLPQPSRAWCVAFAPQRNVNRFIGISSVGISSPFPFGDAARTGLILASGSDDRLVRLWDIDTGECLTALVGHTSMVFTVSFSPDGMLLASGSDDRLIKLWDVCSGAGLKTLKGHTGVVWSVQFSPNGQILASGSHDKTVRLWDVDSGECLKTLDHTSEVWSIAFSPDGHVLASSSTDGSIQLWQVETGDCVRMMRSPKPYEGMNIAGTTGLTAAQKATLQALGAVEIEPS
ncbi:NACHT domain-containing protein [Phormidium tenue FACHB-886]|nr:NACHT domain-containing protein [Phormidium tenue FACHB-886]